MYLFRGWHSINILMYFIESKESKYSKIFGLNIMLVKFIEDFVIKAYCNFVILL